MKRFVNVTERKVCDDNFLGFDWEGVEEEKEKESLFSIIGHSVQSIMIIFVNFF